MAAAAGCTAVQGQISPRKSAKAMQAAVSPATWAHHIAQPVASPAASPSARRTKTYWPPTRGSAVPSSASTLACSAECSAPKAHSARIAPATGTLAATGLGVRMMPEPIISPTAIAMPKPRPRRRSSRPGAVAELISRSETGKVDGAVEVEAPLGRRQRIFQSIGAVEQHHAVIRADAAFAQGLHIGGMRRRAFRAEEKAFALGHLFQTRFDVFVAHRQRVTPTLAHRGEDEKVADGGRHADARRDGVRVLPARGVALARIEGAHDGSAALRLHRHPARALGSDEADGLEFGESLPHADEAGAAAGGIEDDVRHLPAQLLDQLEAHRLLALNA